MCGLPQGESQGCRPPAISRYARATADQTPPLTSLSPGAAACKLPLAKLKALSATMGSIPKTEGDDAAVLRLDNERAPVLTTDFFWHGARRRARSPRMDSGCSAG